MTLWTARSILSATVLLAGISAHVNNSAVKVIPRDSPRNAPANWRTSRWLVEQCQGEPVSHRATGSGLHPALLQCHTFMLTFAARQTRSLLPMSQSDTQLQKGEQIRRQRAQFQLARRHPHRHRFRSHRPGGPLPRGAYANVEDVPYNRFLELLENKQIDRQKFSAPNRGRGRRPTQTLRGAYLKQGVGPNPAQQQVPFRTTIYSTVTKNLQEKLEAAGIPYAVQTDSNLIGTNSGGFCPDRGFPGHSLFPLPPADPRWPAKAR